MAWPSREVGGSPRACIAHETTEVIDLIPTEVIVRCDIREVLACQTCDAELVRAPTGDKGIEAGAYGSRLVADLVVGKYRDGCRFTGRARSSNDSAR